MSASSSTTWATRSPAATSWRSAAVIRGIGLIGVAKGFARSVLGLGQVMSGAVARLKAEGGNPYSANAGFDFVAVLSLLQRAVLMADALRARLRTPAVAIALARFATGRAGARNERPQADAEPDTDDALWRIAYVRGDKQRLQGWRQAIEEMSDREVLTYIHADLLAASEMLGETDVAAEIRALGCKASALLSDDADEVAPAAAAPGNPVSDTATARVAIDSMPDEDPEPDRTQITRPNLRAVGRGPP